MKTAIDLFAGMGGFTEGAESAGIQVVWAANHWPDAVRVHAKNHPDVEHSCQDLSQADWSKVPKADALLASPACQGHSRARGKERASHDLSRSTAWAVVSCCEHHLPEYLVVENVPEFLQWSLYPAWINAIHRLGYGTSIFIADAADAGVPQNRIRLFIIGRRDRGSQCGPMKLGRNDDAIARNFIDFDGGSWSPIIKPGRSPKTIARWERGREQHGDRFVMPYYGSGSGLTGRSIDRPIGTITTRDRWAVVDGDRMRMLSVDEYRLAMGFPDTYQLPRTRKQAIHMLGNAVPPPLAAQILNYAVN